MTWKVSVAEQSTAELLIEQIKQNSDGPPQSLQCGVYTSTSAAKSVSLEPISSELSESQLLPGESHQNWF